MKTEKVKSRMVKKMKYHYKLNNYKPRNKKSKVDFFKCEISYLLSY